MKVYNEFVSKKLNSQLQKELLKIREKRNFNPKEYINEKARLLNDYMNEYNLKSCVVAVSGGIDSAIVLGIVKEAMNKKSSPIKKVVSLLMPVYNEGATNQDKATTRGIAVCNKFNFEPFIIDLTKHQELLRDNIDKEVKIKGEAWASGQVVAYLRTPTIYYTTSLLSQEGLNPIFCGTTNRDEGAYLGYFGKASDGMVDVQLISDIHKNEVFAVAKELNVPQEIIETIPAGDMYDGREDEEVFGAPYDFVEFYLNFKNLSEKEKTKIVNSLDEETKNQFKRYSNNLENLHNYNKHKYLGCSPAVHLDILESKVKGGWKYYNYEK